MPHKRHSIWYTFGLIIVLILITAGVMFDGSAFAQTPAVVPPEDAQINTHLASIAPEINLGANSKPQTAGIDHGVFEVLQRDFDSPQELTMACLSCHITSADEVMHTTHWTWEYFNKTTGQVVGKKNELNNFCIATSSNEPRCTSCHVGYGWKDDTFDFTAEQNVDCLVCHDTTGTYVKPGPAAGMPAGYTGMADYDTNPVDLTYIAHNVGAPNRNNCLVCHAYGGGGDAVKHGDIDSSLTNPDHSLDVHMDAEGLNFSCSECHLTENHHIGGSRYEHDDTVKSCIDCHGVYPHEAEVTNRHSEKVACQSCHIPAFARGGLATKMTWDWSTAGEKNEDGSIIATEEYNTLKGTFTWEENVTPEYVWFNGIAGYTLVTDEIDPTNVVSVNQFQGDKDDPNAKLWPTKRFTGKQPYDTINNVLVVPHLFGKDENAYWAQFDWDKAISAGMESVGAEYSGEYDFIATEYYWPITHMVAPASEALQCRDCHDPENGRLDFIALGYDEAKADQLTWELDEYARTSPESLRQLVSQPSDSQDWMYWLTGIIALFITFEITATRLIHIEGRHEQK